MINKDWKNNILFSIFFITKRRFSTVFTLTRNTNIWHKYRCIFVYPITWKYYVHIYRTGKKKTHMQFSKRIAPAIKSSALLRFRISILLPVKDINPISYLNAGQWSNYGSSMRTWVQAFRVTWLASWWLPELVQSLSIQYLLITTSWGRIQSREHLLVSINARFHWLV